MYTLFSKSRKIMIVFTLSLMLSGMSALLIASDRDRVRSAAAASPETALIAAGGEAAHTHIKSEAMQASRFGKQPQATGKPYHRVRFTRGATSASKTASRVVPHNIGYDSMLTLHFVMPCLQLKQPCWTCLGGLASPMTRPN